MLCWLQDLCKKVMGARVFRRTPRPSPVILPADISPANRTIAYRIADPDSTYKDLKTEDMEDPTSPKFQVVSFQGGGYEIDTLEGQAASVHMNIDKSLRYYNTFAEQAVSRWSSVPLLIVVPRAGRDMNAYYDRRSLSFFFWDDKSLGKTIYAGDSPDVVLHELGHAVLDCKRPDFWNVPILEVEAMHEAWGDIFSMIMELRHPELAQHLLNTTDGDLRKPNVISSLAEQMGGSIYRTYKQPGGSPNWLRTALNDHKYVDPSSLPSQSPDDQICAESHSFSKIMTATCYELMMVIYETEVRASQTTVTALINAAKGLGWYVDRAINRTPTRTNCFQGFANAILQVDREMSNSYYQKSFSEVLEKRGLYKPLQSLSLGTVPMRHVCLNEVLPLRSLSLSPNPLYDVEIEIPDEGEHSILAAQRFVDYLHTHGLVGPSPELPFEVSNGKLIRSHIAFDYYRQNWLNPTQPEYSKPPKPQNHFRPCGCGKQTKETETLSSKKIIREANIRYKVY